MKKLPVHSREGLQNMACAASAIMSGVRHRCSSSLFLTANSIEAVAIPYRGHSELKATPSGLNSSAIPRVTIDIAYFEIVYATCPENHFGSMFKGGDSVRTCGLFEALRNESAALAAPSYLHASGISIKPSDLAQHNCLIYIYLGEIRHWSFKKGNEEISVSVDGDFRTNITDMSSLLRQN